MNSASRYSLLTNSLIDNITQYIGGAVIGFFLISGVFFRSKGKISHNFLKTSKRIMPSFFIFSITYSFLMFFLGKTSIIDGLYKTFSFSGASMQLYYLPYLLGVYLFYLLFHRIFKTNHKFEYILIGLLTILALISLFFPTTSPTGPSLKLVPIYALSFGVGIYLSNIKSGLKLRSFLIIALCILLGFYDFRFFHISFMLTLIIVSILLSYKYSILNKQFPGSGGVYLTHTPIINFGISVILISIGINEQSNLFFTLILTYIITLLITYSFIKFFPKYKFLMLE
jgi:hypothetical protein